MDPCLTTTRGEKKKDFNTFGGRLANLLKVTWLWCCFLVILRAGASPSHPSYSLITPLANAFDVEHGGVSQKETIIKASLWVILKVGLFLMKHTDLISTKISFFSMCFITLVLGGRGCSSSEHSVLFHPVRPLHRIIKISFRFHPELYCERVTSPQCLRLCVLEAIVFPGNSSLWNWASSSLNDVIPSWYNSGPLRVYEQTKIHKLHIFSKVTNRTFLYISRVVQKSSTLVPVFAFFPLCMLVHFEFTV